MEASPRSLSGALAVGHPRLRADSRLPVPPADSRVVPRVGGFCTHTLGGAHAGTPLISRAAHACVRERPEIDRGDYRSPGAPPPAGPAQGRKLDLAAAGLGDAPGGSPASLSIFAQRGLN